MGDPSPELLRLVDAVQLQTVDCLKLYAERKPRASSSEAEETVDPSYTLNYSKRDDGQAFRISLLTELSPSVGDIAVEMAAEYAVPGIDLDEVSDETLLEFANEVGLMAVLPYVRTAIADATLRVFETALLMPVIRRGELNFRAISAAGAE